MGGCLELVGELDQFLVKQGGVRLAGGRENVGQAWAAAGSPGSGGIVEANGLWPPSCTSQILSNGLAFSGVAYSMSTCPCTRVYASAGVHTERGELGKPQLSPSVKRR